MENTTPNETTQTLRSTTSGFRKWLKKAINDPAFVIVSIAFAVAAWYVPNHILDPIDEQKAVSIKLDEELRTTLGKVSENLVQGLKELDEKADTRTEKLKAELSVNIGEKFATLNKSLDTQIATATTVLESRVTQVEKNVDEDINTLNEKTDKNASSIPDATQVNATLEQQEQKIAELSSTVDTTERSVNNRQHLLELGIKRPVVLQAMLTLMDKNIQFTESSDELTELWETKGEDLGESDFEQYLLGNYTVTPKDAMLIAYSELTEPKPAELFIKWTEITASAEPPIGEARAPVEFTDTNSGTSSNIANYKAPDLQPVRPEPDSIEPVLATPLTIVDICEEMTDIPTLDCYRYFIQNKTVNFENIGLTEKEGSNTLIRAIADKYQKIISAS